MDSSNLEDIEDMADSITTERNANLGKVQLFGQYRGPNSKVDMIIRDPYYGGTSGFEDNFKQLTLFSEGFLKEVFGVKL